MENQPTHAPALVEELLAAQLLQWQNLKAELEAKPVQRPATKDSIIYCDCKVIEFENELALLRR